MIDITNYLIENFKKRTSSPFLFIGSGFSKRYIDTDDWVSLLSRFCTDKKPYQYYLSMGGGDIPTAAGLIAKDFNEIWWSDSKYEESRSINKDDIKDETSALRIEISNYLKSKDENETNELYKEETTLLSKANVDGIITTNWDMLIEKLFPTYEVYTGQSELLFSTTQNIAEIYKIHGSRHKPSSLTLTDKDYLDFNEKNPYLASKLITIFVEHPVIFIGYSLSDTNIRALLRSISTCIGNDNIDKLRNNLIFLNRIENQSDTEGVSDTIIAINEIQIPIKQIKTNDYSKVYKAIVETKRKMPAKLLRNFKDEFYSLVKDNTPENEKKLCVVDIDDIDDYSKVEFVVGIGVAEQKREEENVSKLGYIGLTPEKIILNNITSEKELDSNILLKDVLPKYTNLSYITIWKHLSAIGINKKSELEKSELKDLLWKYAKTKDCYKNQSFKSKYEKKYFGMTLSDLINIEEASNILGIIPFLNIEKHEIPILENFIISNKELIEESRHKTNFRKLICFHDYIKYCKDN